MQQEAQHKIEHQEEENCVVEQHENDVLSEFEQDHQETMHHNPMYEDHMQ